MCWPQRYKKLLASRRVWSPLALTAVGALVLGPAPPPCARAASSRPPTLVLPKSVTIRAFLDQPDEFVEIVWARAKRGPVKGISLLPSRLSQQHGDKSIGAQHVNVSGPKALSPGGPGTFTVKVSGVRYPGRYVGTLLVVVAKARARPLSVQLIVLARERPELRLVGELKEFTLQATRCSWLCFLMPRGDREENTFVWLRNDGRSQVRIVSRELQAAGGGRALSQAALGSVVAIRGRSSAKLPLSLDPADKVEPGHYEGVAWLRLRNRDELVAVPVKVDVRAGPLWALVALGVGGLLGIGLLDLRGAGGKQAAALWELMGLKSSIRHDLTAELDKNALLGQLATVRKQVYLGDLETARASAKGIRTGIEVLKLAEEIDRLIAGRTDPASEQARARLVDVRNEVRAGRYNDALTAVTAVRDSLPPVGAAAPPDRPGLEQAYARAQRAIGSLILTVDALNKVGVQEVRPLLGRLERLGGWVAAHGGAGLAYLRLVARWPLRIVALLALLYVGYDSLYVNDATFGDGGLVDYLALAAWGVGSDVASRLTAMFIGAPAS